MAPGRFANQTNGRAHQISRATATTASAPPYCAPSDNRNRSSLRRTSFFIPSSAPTRGSCSGATAMPRRSRIGAIQRAIRVQNPHSASKKSQPLARRPLPSVYSFAREIMACLLHLRNFVSSVLSVVKSFCPRLSTNLLLVAPQQGNHLAAQLAHALQRAHGHAENLFEQTAHDGQEIEHALQSLAGIGVPGRRSL